MSERTDGDRIVVCGYSAGSHFPRVQSSIQYRFEANGESSDGPFFIDGSVYGRDIRLRGPGTIRGPVLGRADITLENRGTTPQRMLGGLHASGNVVSVSRGGVPLKKSLAGDVAAADYVVRGDVVGEHVALENSVVFGNVRGRHVRLTQSIVFGQVLAAEAAILSASTWLSYAAPEVCFEGPCAVLFAMGTSEKPPVFKDYTDGDGVSWGSDLRYYALFRRVGPLTNRCWEESTPAYEMSRLFPSDWARVDAECVERRLMDGKTVERLVATERYVLSVAGRALNFGAIAQELEGLVFMLKTSLEFTHYHPNVQAAVRKQWEERCTADELSLLRAVTDPAEARPTGVEPRPRSASSARGRAPATEVAAPSRPGRDSREVVMLPVKIYLADGSVRGGRAAPIGPNDEALRCSPPREGDDPTSVPLSDILVVVFDVGAGPSASPPEGRRLTVVTVQGWTIAGRSSDFRDASTPFSIVPEPRSQAADLLWIGPRAVRSIAHDSTS